MSSDWFNIRFGSWHLHIGKWELKFKRNPYWVANKPNKWFAVYCFFGQHYD